MESGRGRVGMESGLGGVGMESGLGGVGMESGWRVYNAPCGSPPLGDKFCQKMLWLM